MYLYYYFIVIYVSNNVSVLLLHCNICQQQCICTITSWKYMSATMYLYYYFMVIYVGNKGLWSIY